MMVRTILQTVWRYREEGAAWLLLNLAPEDRAVHLDLEAPTTAGDRPSRRRLTLVRDGELPVDLGDLTERRTVTLPLPSRSPITIESVPTHPA